MEQRRSTTQSPPVTPIDASHHVTRAWVQISELKHFNFDFKLEEGRNIKVISPKYQNMIRLKISKYRLYRRRFLRPRRHFLAFFKLYQEIQLKTRQHFKNRINPSHQNLMFFFYTDIFYILIFRLLLTIFHILIFHLHFIFVF